MAQMPPLQYGSRSPDGQYWWDGSAWQPVPAGAQVAPTYPAAYAPAVSGARGVPGQQRSIGTSILLAIITIGIYTYVWVYKTQNEIKRYSGIGVGGVLGLVIYFVLSPATFFVVPSEVRQMYEANGRQSPVRGTTGFWVLLPLIGPIVWFVKVQGALNNFWASVGAPGAGMAAPAAPSTPPSAPPPGYLPPPPASPPA